MAAVTLTLDSGDLAVAIGALHAVRRAAEKDAARVEDPDLKAAIRQKATWSGDAAERLRQALRAAREAEAPARRLPSSSVLTRRPLVGEVESRVPRQTGYRTVLIDALQPGDYRVEEGGRWVTLCEKHGEFVQHETRGTARSFLSAPVEWCDGCRTAVAKGDRP